MYASAKSIDTKFVALLEHKTLFRMTPSSSSSDNAFKVKLKFTLFDLELDFESNVFHVVSVSKSQNTLVYLQAKFKVVRSTGLLQKYFSTMTKVS